MYECYPRVAEISESRKKDLFSHFFPRLTDFREPRISHIGSVTAIICDSRKNDEFPTHDTVPDDGTVVNLYRRFVTPCLHM